MQCAAMTRAMLWRSFGSPLGALLACAALAAWPGLLVLAPLVIRADSSRVQSWTYELAFMLGALGTALAAAERKRLEPWTLVSMPRVPAAVDALALFACGLAFATISTLPSLFLSAGTAAPVGTLPLLALSAAWGTLAIRTARSPEATGWITALGSALLPALELQPGALVRSLCAVAALVFGAWCLDHPPGGPR